MKTCTNSNFPYILHPVLLMINFHYVISRPRTSITFSSYVSRSFCTSRNSVNRCSSTEVGKFALLWCFLSCLRWCTIEKSQAFALGFFYMLWSDLNRRRILSVKFVSSAIRHEEQILPGIIRDQTLLNRT